MTTPESARVTTLTTTRPSSRATVAATDLVSGLLVGAFTLSVAHTGYAWASGLEDPDFTVTTPLTWAYYAIGFGSAGLVRRDRAWARTAVAAYLVVLLAISLFYYPTTFVPAHQTVFGWVENDASSGCSRPRSS